MNNPDGLAFDNVGNLYVADFENGDITKVTPDGTQSIFATGLADPNGLAFDSAGNLFVGNYGTGEITKITPTGSESIFASGFGSTGYMAFGPAPTSAVPEPSMLGLFGIGALVCGGYAWLRTKRTA